MSHSDSPECGSFTFKAPDPEARASARLTIDRWQEIAATLTPIIGQREVTRLFERSIHLCKQTCPWMEGSHGGLADSMNLNDLERSIAQQPAPIAAAGAGLLLGTFQDLFADLVGGTLAAEVLPASLIRLPTRNDAT